MNRTRKLATATAVTVLLAGGLVFAFTTSTAATAETSAFADTIQSLKTTDQMGAELEAALAALNERNAQATALYDSTAGKVLDDAVRVQLLAERDAAAALAGSTVPMWQHDAEKLLTDLTTANAAYDVSAAAVSANHEAWVIATTPPPPAPAAPAKPRSNGSSKSNGSSGGGSSSGGGGYGGPSGGDGQDWGGLVITPGNPNWEKPVGPGTTFE